MGFPIVRTAPVRGSIFSTTCGFARWHDWLGLLCQAHLSRTLFRSLALANTQWNLVQVSRRGFRLSPRSHKFGGGSPVGPAAICIFWYILHMCCMHRFGGPSYLHKHRRCKFGPRGISMRRDPIDAAILAARMQWQTTMIWSACATSQNVVGPSQPRLHATSLVMGPFEGTGIRSTQPIPTIPSLLQHSSVSILPDCPSMIIASSDLSCCLYLDMDGNLQSACLSQGLTPLTKLGSNGLDFLRHMKTVQQLEVLPRPCVGAFLGTQAPNGQPQPWHDKREMMVYTAEFFKSVFELNRNWTTVALRIARRPSAFDKFCYIFAGPSLCVGSEPAIVGLSSRPQVGWP